MAVSPAENPLGGKRSAHSKSCLFRRNPLRNWGGLIAVRALAKQELQRFLDDIALRDPTFASQLLEAASLVLREMNPLLDDCFHRNSFQGTAPMIPRHSGPPRGRLRRTAHVEAS